MAKRLTKDGEIVELTFKAFQFKTPYNHDTNLESDATGVYCPEETKTIQSQKDEADINVLVKRFGLDKNPQFGNIPIPPGIEEFVDVFDYQTAMNTIRTADESFAQLHPDVRAKFNHSPALFVGTIDHILNETDPKKRERGLEDLREMGLAVPKALEPAPAPTPPPAPAPGGDKP